jgi:FkbM family methyltransferase
MNLKRLGTHYGGWWIDLDLVSDKSIVYSVGIGEDASFDIELLKEKNCLIHGFDPTPRSIEWVEEQKLSENFVFHSYGIGSTDSIVDFYPPERKDWISHSIIMNPKVEPIKVKLRCLSSIMKELQHDHIDLLKMDIEGAEYEVLDSIIFNNINIEQICAEFHTVGEIDIQKEVKRLCNAGRYNVIKIEDNNYTFSKDQFYCL